MIFRKSQHVSTTTWPERHEGTFGELGRQLERLEMRSPTVLEIGPGAVTTLLRDRLLSGEGEKLSALSNRYRAVLRNIDGLIRRIPGVPLCSYEPGELQRVLPPDSRHQIVDISPAVVEALRKQYPHLEGCVYDFSAQPFPITADVIVCLCVLVRTQCPQAIFSNVYRSLRAGGLLVMDHRSCRSFGSPEFPLEQLAAQIWQKPPASISE